MIDTSTLLYFLTAAVLLTLTPGPDILFLITQGVTRGARAGVATAMGLAAGNLAHTLGAVLGISLIFRTSALAFQTLKLAGVLYLLFLAYKAIRTGVAVAPADEEGIAAQGPLFRRGLLMNTLNPKVALFFLAFLPQFVTPDLGPVWQQMLIYGLLFTLQVVLVFGAVGLFAGGVNRWLQLGAGGRLAGIMKWVTAAVFVSLAVNLFLIEW